MIQSWQTEQRRKLTEEKAKKTLDRIKGGEKLEAVASSIGAAIETSPPFNRQGNGATNHLPRGLASELFGVKVGGASSAPSGSDYIIGVLKEIKEAKASSDRAAVNALAEQIAQRISSDLEVQYNNALRKQHTVEIDQRAIANVLLQF